MSIRALTMADVRPLMALIEEIIPKDVTVQIAADADKKIADFFGVEEKPFLTSLESAYWLFDQIAPKDDYVSVDYREYREYGAKSYVLVDINNDCGGSIHGSGRGATRAIALVQAALSSCVSQIEYLHFEAQ